MTKHARPAGRTPQVSYLRVSVTDRCNQRCVYCMPAEGVPAKSHETILRFEEIERIVRAAVPLGVKSVRLTGGEPLVRRGIVECASRLAAVPGVEDLALTTNGLLLPDLVRPLKEAGVRRVNVSLDTLRPGRYREITRTDAFDQVWAGIETALAAGFDPVKINTVMIRDVNDDEIEDMALVAAGLGDAAPAGLSPPAIAGRPVWRFIELMPLGEGRDWDEAALVPADEIVGRLANLASRHGLPFEEEVGREDGKAEGQRTFGAGPARYFRLGSASVGVISPMTHGFCAWCNRLRLTSDGRLHPCLTSPLTVDIAGPLRAGASDEELTRILARAVSLKPEAHRMDERRPELAQRRMSQIGG